MLLGYRLDDYQKYGIKVPISTTVPFKNSNILLVGKSGAGKSLCGRWYIYHLLHTHESYIYIADYKGGTEYEDFEGSHSYASGKEAIKMIDDFYDLFRIVRQKKIRLNQHYSLYIEEYSGLLAYAETQSKKLKSDIILKVGELLSVSRGLNMGIILCVQRADAALFSNGARDNFQTICALGRISTEQFKMLGFSGELEDNPTYNFRSGMGLCLIDNQDGVQEIIVPFIKNQDELCRGIRYYLDKQSDIPSLIQELTEGDGVVQ